MKIRVQMPLGTGQVSVGGHPYDADEQGVVTLDSPEHVAPLVNLGGVELGENDEPGSTSTLIGTNIHPAMVELGEGREARTLGAIVAETHARTSISVDQWNNLPQAIRDLLIDLHISELRGEFGRIAESETDPELTTALEDVDRLQADFDRAQARIAELEGELAAARDAGTGGDASQPAPPADAATAPPARPDFANLTKAQISDWVVANGGEAVAPGNHDTFVAAGNAHYDLKFPVA